MNPSLQIGSRIRNAKDLGAIVAARRKAQRLTQLDLAGLGQTGNRFICELENGKKTLQFDKVMAVLEMLGFDVIIVPRGAGAE